jgi:hypothetical protein
MRPAFRRSAFRVTRRPETGRRRGPRQEVNWSVTARRQVGALIPPRTQVNPAQQSDDVGLSCRCISVRQSAVPLDFMFTLPHITRHRRTAVGVILHALSQFVKGAQRSVAVAGRELSRSQLTSSWFIWIGVSQPSSPAAGPKRVGRERNKNRFNRSCFYQCSSTFISGAVGFRK